jgi:hypothetical protein
MCCRYLACRDYGSRPQYDSEKGVAAHGGEALTLDAALRGTEKKGILNFGKRIKRQ